MLEFALFIIGFFLLVRGAEWLVDGAADFAKKIGINELMVGLTVVAFGTSLPELIVSLFAAGESAGLTIGNVLGSNAANILLVLGLAAAIKPLTVHRLTVNREVVFNIMASFVLLVLAADHWLLGEDHLFEGLTRTDGIVLLSYFLVFLYYVFGKSSFAASQPKPIYLSNEAIKAVPMNLLKIAIGMLSLYLGGRWIVTGALSLSDQLGLAEEFVGLTVVALGTSLPELAASITAIRKNKVDLAIGNAVGSNLFNILWVLGLSAFIAPLEFGTTEVIDTAFVAGISLLLFFTVAFGKYKHQISRLEGRFFLLVYAVYLIYISLR